MARIWTTMVASNGGGTLVGMPTLPGDSYVVPQGAPYSLVKEYSLNYIGIQNMIQNIFPI